MRYKIVGESHEGVVSADQEILDRLEADSPENALYKFSIKNNAVRYISNWQCWLIGARRIWAEESGQRK